MHLGSGSRCPTLRRTERVGRAPVVPYGASLMAFRSGAERPTIPIVESLVESDTAVKGSLRRLLAALDRLLSWDPRATGSLTRTALLAELYRKGGTADYLRALRPFVDEDGAKTKRGNTPIRPGLPPGETRDLGLARDEATVRTGRHLPQAGLLPPRPPFLGRLGRGGLEAAPSPGPIHAG